MPRDPIEKHVPYRKPPAINGSVPPGLSRMSTRPATDVPSMRITPRKAPILSERAPSRNLEATLPIMEADNRAAPAEAA